MRGVLKTIPAKLIFGWLLLLGSLCQAQVKAPLLSHSTIYTNDSVRFTVYLDGRKMNPVPQTRVRCINLDQPYYKLRIVFEDKSETIERQRFYLRDTYGYPVALEHLLKRNKKGSWKMKWKAQESWPNYVKPGADTYQMPDPDAETLPALPCGGITMDETRFNTALESIRQANTDEAKLLISKQVVNSNCVNVAQLKKLLPLFAQEDKKVELAQYAYPYTVDKGNYFEINSEFKDPKSVEVLYRNINK